MLFAHFLLKSVIHNMNDLYAVCSLGLSSNSFRFLIKDLLDAFVAFMQNKRVRMTCQNMALKHLPAVIPHLTYHSVYDSADLT